MFRDPYEGDGFKLQFSFRYNFSAKHRRSVSHEQHALRVGPSPPSPPSAWPWPRPRQTPAQTPDQIEAGDEGRPCASTRTSRKARTPTTSRRWPRSTRTCSASPLVTADGKVYTAGDVKTEVSIQSISKVFTMAQVIQEQGARRHRQDHRRGRHRRALQLDHRHRGRPSDGRHRRAGDEPAGQPRGHLGHRAWCGARSADEVWKKIIGIHNDFAGRQLTVLQDVYKSEADTNQRNQAIGALMLAYGYIKAELAAGRRPLHPAVLDRRQRAATWR